MKKILAWATDYRKERFAEYEGLDIQYVDSLEEFEASLTKDCIPAISITPAVDNFEGVARMLDSNPDIRFYFLEYDVWELIRDSEEETMIPDYFERQSKDWDLRDWTRGNVEVRTQTNEDIIRLALMKEGIGGCI